jgi:glycerol-3-phosphate O-acyltransferase
MATTVYLLDVDDDVDEMILRRWVVDHGGDLGNVIDVPHPRAQDAALRLGPLTRRIAEGDDIELAPLRVAWLPEEHDGERAARIRDILKGDPRNPSTRRKSTIMRGDDSRAQVVVADSARLSDVRARAGAPDDGDSHGLAAFVARQAYLALERAEYHLLGARYKVPRLVREELTSSASFRRRSDELADQLGRGHDEVWAEVQECLEEMVTGYSRMFLDLMARMGRRIKLSKGYGDDIDYDEAQLERTREVLAKHPAVILPSHKSNLDALIIPVALHENGLPPTHTFAGINMAFWPYGAIFRRAGRIFIRRDIKGDPVYRWVLREYLGYLVEKRFTMEWYIEGTRSRTGKLAPPKLGLLRYIADACREGRTDDVAMVPVSIIYDQLHEVGEYASEAMGTAKKAETLGWALKFMRSQKGHYGKIYVRFGEPISLREAVELEVGEEEQTPQMSDDDIRLQKLAFEVCTRINAVTPITANALVCLVLLATRGRALSASELHGAVRHLLDAAQSRELPLTASATSLATEPGVRVVVEALATNGTIDAYDEGDRPVYMIGRDHHLAAAFYRNTIVHFYVNSSIAEVALISAAEAPVDGTAREDAFWDEAYALRDLLKFDFFFEQREQFRTSIGSALDQRLPGWREHLAAGDAPSGMLDEMRPLLAFGILRPFVEAYLIVARALMLEPLDEPIDRKGFAKRCLSLGGQWLRQDEIRSPEAVSKYLFQPAIQLAEHRKLTVPGADLQARRQQFADQLTDIDRRMDLVERRSYAVYRRSLAEHRG